MNAIDLAQAYLGAWNSHDVDGIIKLFTSNGTYSDPNVSDGISGQVIADYASALMSAFPDLQFESPKLLLSGDNIVIAEWIMTGTNSGSLRGLPPTGQEISLPGIDVIETAEDGISSIRGYFNSGTMMEQLGLQVIVQPKSMGPVSFGNSAYINIGNNAKPGVIGITQIQLASPDQNEELHNYTRAVLQEISQIPGYISTATTLTSGGHGVTVTAWEDMESAKNAVAGAAHKEAMKAHFAKDGLGESLWTSFWTEGQLNTRWQRCNECRNMAVVTSELKCKCGAALTEPPWF